MNYSIGIDIEGFDRREINDVELLSNSTEDNRILIYLNTEVTEDKLPVYYTSIQGLFKNPLNSLLLVNNDDLPSPIFQSLLKLFLLYGDYSIYKTYKETVIDKEYALRMFKQEATIDDVEQYISREAVGYDQISEALLKLVDFIQRDSTDELVSYVNHNKDMLLRTPIIFDTLKAYEADIANGTYGKLVETMQELEKANKAIATHSDNENLLDSKIINLKTELEQQRQIVAAREEIITTYNAKIQTLSDENSELRNQLASGGSGGGNGGKVTSLADLVGGSGEGFTEVVSLKLPQIRNNRLRKVIYIKEVTRPAYINTFMVQLLRHLDSSVSSCKNNIKMVIFDNRVDFAQVYNPLPLLNSGTYFEGDLRDRLHRKNNENIMVFTDLNPVYIENLATKSEFDNLIIYDRLGKEVDLLHGGAVVKFYTFGSNHNIAKYTERHSEIKAGDMIVNAGSKALNGAVEIIYSEEYKNSTEPNRRDIVFKRTHMKSFKTLISKCGY